MTRSCLRRNLTLFQFTAAWLTAQVLLLQGKCPRDAMAPEEDLSSNEFNLIKLNVASGTQITTRAANVIETINKSSSAEKPTVVSLSTRSRNANKLISIVEIAKRDLIAKGVKIYQYNALSSEMVELERKPKQANGADAQKDGGDEREDASDDAFETMGEKALDGPKKRRIPVMTTYLSTSSIKELKTKFGYGTRMSILNSHYADTEKRAGLK